MTETVLPAAVVCADATALLPAMANRCVDAVITDPPWNTGRPYGRHNDDMAAQAYKAWLGAVVAECARVSRGPVALLIGIRNNGLISNLVADNGLHAVARLHWRRISGVEETVLIAASDPMRLPPGKLQAARRTLLVCGEEREHRGHPCPKPVAALDALIRLLTSPGALILDPFVGTGSTLVAAVRADRRGLGIELEARFCRVAVERLRT